MKRTRIMARSKSPRKKLVRKLDAVHSLYIRTRDKRCVTCGATQNLTNGHLFSRQSYSTRWHERNCNGQCSGCNLRHEHDPYPYNSWFIRKFGQGEWDELHREYATPRKFKNHELAEMISHYEQALKELTGE